MAKPPKATKAAGAKVLAGLMGANPLSLLTGGIASPQARYNPQRPTPFVPPNKRTGSKRKR